MRPPVRLLNGGTAAALCALAWTSPASSFDGAAAVGDEALAEVRGGFDLGPGLKVSFGIERALYLNGQLASATAFRLPDLGRVTPAQAAAAAQALSTLTVVRDGQVQALPAAHGGTWVQNSLNDQRLRSVTTLDVASSGLGLMKSINANRTLIDALAVPRAGR